MKWLEDKGKRCYSAMQDNKDKDIRRYATNLKCKESVSHIIAHNDFIKRRFSKQKQMNKGCSVLPKSKLEP